MATTTRALSLEDARRHIGERAFPHRSGRRVGIELEWLTTPSENPTDVSTLEQLLSPLAPLPGGSRITFEPGGQVELSSETFDTVADACAAVAADTEVLRAALIDHGIELFAAGIDPDRDLALRTDGPRYLAMRRYFDAFGPAGGRMMCGTAAIHINVDAGRDDEGVERWRAAHAIGPALLAAFTNSPIADTGVTGWKSSRFAAWERIDPTRTTAVPHDGDPASAWADYALAARVMLVRRDDDHFETMTESFSFADWIEAGFEGVFPTVDDLDYHLTTLFPPVRPHGYLELRWLDMGPWWRAAVGVTTVLLLDPQARAEAVASCTATQDEWTLAARCGMEDDRVCEAAKACFAAALAAAERVGIDPITKREMETYMERFVARGRSPADDVLDRAREDR